MNRSFIMLLAVAIFLGAGFGGSFVGGVIYGQNQAGNAGDQLSPRLETGGQFPAVGQGVSAGRGGQQRRDRGGGSPAAQGQGAGVAGNQGPGLVAAQEQGNPMDGGQNRVPRGAPQARAAGQARANEADRQLAEPGRENQVNAPAATPAGAVGSAASSSPGAIPSETGVTGEGRAQGNVRRPGTTGTVKGLEGDVLTIASPQGYLPVILSEGTRVFEVSEADRKSLVAESRVRVVGSRNPEGGIAAQSLVVVPEGAENLFAAPGNPRGGQHGQAP